VLYTGGCRGRASSMCPAYGLMCKGMVVLAEQPVTGTMRHADAAMTLTPHHLEHDVGPVVMNLGCIGDVMGFRACPHRPSDPVDGWSESCP
jgi:hypothetical protein